MLNRLSVATIWVTDHNEALPFYTEKLGFETCADVKKGDCRWLRVGLKGQPDLEFHLEAVKPAVLLTQEEADQLTKLVEAGKIGSGPW